jgi:competence protein ComEC
MPKREASLGKSYLLGMKTGLDKDISENLKLVGLTHVVVASGAHLSILVEVARKIFGRVSRFSGLLFSILFILFFMTMVGFSPSILRAGVMAILTLASWYVGRKIAPWRLILITMAFTLMLNPMFLAELGFLLSFASYIGIMMLGPSISKFFYGEKKPGFVASVIITTVAATLMTLPITLYYFGQVSIISILANLLILPTLPLAMGLTFAAGVFQFGFLAEKLLDFHILIVEWLASMEQFLIKIERYNPAVFLIYLIILIPFLWWFFRRVFRWTRDRKSGKIKILCQDTVNGQQLKDKKR